MWIHTRMVIGELIALPAWRALSVPERELLFCAAVLHDAGKPATTRVEGGWITSRGHSGKGARMSRRILWEMGFAPELREDIAALVRYHQLPYYAANRPDRQRLVIETSQSARTDHLAILVEADVRGRICPDLAQLLANIAIFGELCRGEQCWGLPRAFPSDDDRFAFFRTAVYEGDPVLTMTLLSGLPAAGKDVWLSRHFDGPMVDSRERALEHLSAGRSFAWNGTNIGRDQRGQAVDLAAFHRAWVRIVWVEAPRTELWKQNRLRDQPVPELVMNALLDCWETPDLCEAHEVVKVW